MHRVLLAAIVATAGCVDMSLATRRRFVGRATAAASAAATAAATTPAFAAKTYVSGMSRRSCAFASTPSKREREEHGRHARRQEPGRPARKRRHEGHEERWLVSSMPGGLCGPLRKSVWPGPAPADARRVPQPVPRRVLRDVRAVHVHDTRCVSKLSNDYTAIDHASTHRTSQFFIRNAGTASSSRDSSRATTARQSDPSFSWAAVWSSAAATASESMTARARMRSPMIAFFSSGVR